MRASLIQEMATFFATLIFFLLMVSAMAVGVALSGRRLQGSCGGSPGGACACSAKRRAACQKKARPHADVPIDPTTLNRGG